MGGVGLGEPQGPCSPLASGARCSMLSAPAIPSGPPVRFPETPRGVGMGSACRAAVGALPVLPTHPPPSVPAGARSV